VKIKANVMKSKSYVHYDYEAYNAAVDLDLSRQAVAIQKLQSEKRAIDLKNILFILGVLGVLLLTLALLYLLLFRSDNENKGDSKSLVHQSQLSEISNAQKSAEKLRSKNVGFTTTFSIFSKGFTTAGDPIITAMEYLPSNVNQPHWQYCYLRSATGNLQSMIATKKEDDDIEIKTDDQYLIDEALPLCTFIN